MCQDMAGDGVCMEMWGVTGTEDGGWNEFYWVYYSFRRFVLQGFAVAWAHSSSPPPPPMLPLLLLDCMKLLGIVVAGSY